MHALHLAGESGSEAAGPGEGSWAGKCFSAALSLCASPAGLALSTSAHHTQVGGCECLRRWPLGVRVETWGSFLI